MKYRKATFIKPPRPEIAIPPERLGTFENGSWCAQPKLNGTYNEVIVHPNRVLSTFKRDGTQHKQWSFSEASAAPFHAIPGKNWWVFCCELLNDKTPAIKDVNYIHDCLVADGELLIGRSYKERHQLLCTIFPDAKSTDLGYSLITDKLWRAELSQGPFRPLFDKWIIRPEVEGLVLKDVRTPFSPTHPERGQVKARRPHKNYGF